MRILHASLPGARWPRTCGLSMPILALCALVMAGSVWGQEAFPARTSLGTLLPTGGGDGSEGFVFLGINDGDETSAIKPAGDVNGDGIADMLIANSSTEIFVIFGSSTFTSAVFPLTRLQPFESHGKWWASRITSEPWSASTAPPEESAPLPVTGRRSRYRLPRLPRRPVPARDLYVPLVGCRVRVRLPEAQLDTLVGRPERVDVE